MSQPGWAEKGHATPWLRPKKPQGVVPGKLNLPSRWPGEGLGGVVALDGLDDAGKGAGEEGVEDVVDEGLLLESGW